MADATGGSKGCRDFLTFLHARMPLAKEIALVGGQWEKRPAPLSKHFSVTTAKVNSLADVERRMRKAAEVGAVLIHGVLKAGLKPDDVLRRKANFDDVPHRWVALDLDKLPPGPVDPAKAAEIARAMLPAEFRDAACVWHATSGHALSPGRARLRLVFWADRPVSLPEVDGWLSACQAQPDRAVWRTVQPIYLGLTVKGGPDPVPRRWGRLLGAETVAVPPDLAAVAKAAVERIMTLPPNVTPDAQHAVEDVVALLRSRSPDRILRDGRHMTLLHAANDGFDRGLTETTVLAMLSAWTAGDIESEAELADALREAGVSNAADLAQTVRLNGEELADAWTSGEPLEADAVEHMTNDALQSRTAPIGSLYRAAFALGAVPTVDDALDAISEAFALDRDLSAPAEELRIALVNDEAPEERTAAAMQVVEKLKAGAADALDQLAAIVKAHGTEVEPTPAAQPERLALAKPIARYLHRIVARPLPPVAQLVGGVLIAGEIAVAAGAPGAGKTADLLHLGLCVAEGKPFHGRPTKQGGVLFVGSENLDEDTRRIVANVRRHGRDAGAPFLHEPRCPQLFSDNGKATPDETGIIALANRMQADTGHACRLIILDNLRRIIAPGSTNDEPNVTTLMRALERIRDATGATCLTIHHNTRSEARYAGSGAIESHADSVWQFGPSTKARGTHEIMFGKLRLGDKRQVIQYAFDFEVVAHDTDGDPISTVVAVDVDPTSSLSAVDVEGQDGADLGTPVEAVEVADGMPERVEMMARAASEISTTRERFNAKELYAATNGLRLAAGLGELRPTTLDMVREALIGSGALRVEGHGRARSYSRSSLE